MRVMRECSIPDCSAAYLHLYWNAWAHNQGEPSYDYKGRCGDSGTRSKLKVCNLFDTNVRVKAPHLAKAEMRLTNVTPDRSWILVAVSPYYRIHSINEAQDRYPDCKRAHSHVRRLKQILRHGRNYERASEEVSNGNERVCGIHIGDRMYDCQ